MTRSFSYHDGHAWIDFRSTTLFLGAAADACDIIRALDAPLSSSLTHAAITWTSWAEIVACFKKLSVKCHSLMSLLIFDAGGPLLHGVRPLRPSDTHQITASFEVGRSLYEPWWMDGDAMVEDLRAWFPSRPAISFIPLGGPGSSPTMTEASPYGARGDETVVNDPHEIT
ncbi:hypothetical protein F5Y15DRAFT_404410 [Xylariaceae sp. FL0016]|nr:hypothetical protein F5Y15DRAFT_404410 [Xylariaceae sp. FL0016]